FYARLVLDLLAVPLFILPILVGTHSPLDLGVLYSSHADLKGWDGSREPVFEDFLHRLARGYGSHIIGITGREIDDLHVGEKGDCARSLVLANDRARIRRENP